MNEEPLEKMKKKYKPSRVWRNYFLKRMASWCQNEQWEGRSGPGFDRAWQQRGPAKLPPLNHEKNASRGESRSPKNSHRDFFFSFLMKRTKWGEDWGANWKLVFCEGVNYWSFLGHFAPPNAELQPNCRIWASELITERFFCRKKYCALAATCGTFITDALVGGCRVVSPPPTPPPTRRARLGVSTGSGSGKGRERWEGARLWKKNVIKKLSLLLLIQRRRN